MKTARHIMVVCGVLAAAAACEFISTALIGRAVPAAVFGRFKLMNTVVLLLSGMLMFGQNTVLIRTLSADGLARYDWRRFIGARVGWAALIAAPALLAIGRWLRAGPDLLLVYPAVVAAVAVDYYAALARGAGYDRQSMCCMKLPALLFCAVVGGVLAPARYWDYWPLLLLYAAVWTGCGVALWVWFRRWPCGAEPVGSRRVREGVWIFASAAVFMISMHIDQFFIVRILGYEQLGGYLAVTAVSRGFELLAIGMWFVLMPRYAGAQRRRARRDTAGAALAGAALAVGYWTYGAALLRWVFSGRFDSFGYLLPFFIIAGFVRVVYAVASGIIDGAGAVFWLRRFFLCSLAVTAAGIVGTVVAVSRWGLRGAAAVSVAAWTARMCAAYGVALSARGGGKQRP